MLSTMHCRPNSTDPCVMICGLRTAMESMLIFSAPARRTSCMSSRCRIPPPTVSGTNVRCAALRTMARSIWRFWALAMMS